MKGVVDDALDAIESIFIVFQRPIAMIAKNRFWVSLGNTLFNVIKPVLELVN